MTDHHIDQDEATRFLTAIGDANRLKILFLINKGKLNVGEIVAQFTISRPAISHHLRILREAGVLQSDKQGQEVYYSLNSSFVIDSLRSLADEIEKMAKEK